MSDSIAASNDRAKEANTLKTSTETPSGIRNLGIDNTSHVDDQAGEADSSSPSAPQFLSGIVPEKYLEDERLKSFLFYSKAAGGLLGAIFVCNPLLQDGPVPPPKHLGGCSVPVCRPPNSGRPRGEKIYKIS